MTFSLVGRCGRTGMLGAIVASSSPAVAARCAWARASVGAVCTQNVTDPTLGAALLDRLEAEVSPDEALADVIAVASHIEHRQLTAVDRTGRSAAFSGEHTLGRFATCVATSCAAAGNLLADEAVPSAMAAAFSSNPSGQLGDRLIAAVRAGRDAGGEEGPIHSAGMLIVDTVAWPVTDLRIDWTDADPAEDLAALWCLWRPQADAYVARALDPARAPSYGVPGDR